MYILTEKEMVMLTLFCKNAFWYKGQSSVTFLFSYTIKYSN
jgi:hypothetical protein